MLPKGAKPGPHQRAWLKELETTKLRQGMGSLCVRDFETDKIKGYCCLGIAERLRGVNPRDMEAGSISLEGQRYYGLRTGLGMPENHGPNYTETKGYLPSCSDLNDEEGLSFKQIAKHLRKNFRRYFDRVI